MQQLTKEELIEFNKAQLREIMNYKWIESEKYNYDI